MNDRQSLRVDVIMPTHNGMPYIKQAVRSVLAQTHQNIVFYVVDDGSSDNGATEKFIKDLGDPRIKYIHRKQEGRSAARNYGIAISTSEFVALIDSDDIWEPEKIEKQLRLITAASDTGMVYGLCHIIDENGSRIGKLDNKKRGHLFHYLLGGNKVTGGASMVMVRRTVFDTVGLFRTDMDMAEDWELWLRVARKFKIDYVPEFLASYRIISTATNKYLEKARGLDHALTIMLKEFNLGPFGRARLGTACMKQACSLYLDGGDRKSARRSLFKILAYNPFALIDSSPKMWLVYLRLLFGNPWLRSLRRRTFSSYQSRERTGRKPKLLIISPAHNYGGGETYLKNLLPHLTDKYDIALIGPRFATKFFNESTKTRWLPLFPKMLDKFLRRTHKLKQVYYKLLLSLYRLGSFDIVNVQWFDGELIEAIKKRPLVMNLHTDFLIPRQHDTYVAKVLNSLDRIVCVSRHAKSQLIGRGVSAKKIEVIYNGVVVSSFEFNRQVGRFVTWIGRVEEADKNPQLFVDIARKAYEQNLNLKFRIAGDGSYLPIIRQICPPNLTLSGAVPPEKMSTVYKEAFALCMTSTSEGLPFVAIEAMASGVPVVATAVGGLNELLSGNAGILINDFDADSFLNKLSKLQSDQKLYKSVQNAARKKIERQFSVDKMTASLLKVFSAVVEKR